VKYAFIERHRRVWPICVQCRVLRVSVSGFHQHQARRGKIAHRRHLSDEALLTHISAVYAEHRGAYGWPRIWRELVKCGIRVGKQRVQRLMQQHGIRARGKRRFRVVTTDSRHDLPIAPNLLNRNFTPAAPNQVWSGDITYIATEEGWLFLAVVIDLFSRKVVGWSMRPDLHRSLVIDTLEMGVYQRRPQPGGVDLSLGSRHSVRQRGFPRGHREARHAGFDESQGQLLGQRGDRDAVRIAESRTTARRALWKHSPSQGRSARLAALV